MGAFLATVGKKVAEKAAEREVNKKTQGKQRGSTQIDTSAMDLAGSVPSGEMDLTDATRSKKRSSGKRSD